MQPPITPGYATHLAERLDPGERLLWYGRPRQGILFRASDWLLVPFSMMWTGFAFFWELSVLNQARRGPGVPLVMALFGLPFIAIGLYMVIGRFFTDTVVRRKTEYGVTDRRALILTGLFSRTTKSIDLRTTPQIELTEHTDGTGTISFGPLPAFFPWGRGWQGTHWPGTPDVPAFERVADAAEAFRLIRSLQRGESRT